MIRSRLENCIAGQYGIAVHYMVAEWQVELDMGTSAKPQ